MNRLIFRWVLLVLAGLLLLPGCAWETGGSTNTDAGTDGEGCADDCEAGESACEGEGYKSCGQYDDDACLEWSEVIPCARQETCEDGRCATVCTDECQEGSRRCRDDGVQECGFLDQGNPCLVWGESTACARNEICEDGECVTICDDDCVEGNKRCQDNDYEVCADCDEDPCMEWGGRTACEYGMLCDEGECVFDCSDVCELDATRCDVGEAYEVCGQFDNDECLEWGGLTNCDANLVCVDGACVCDDECQSRDRRCVGGGIEAFEQCVDLDGDGCLEWSDQTVCSPQYLCEAGMCVPDCIQECSQDSRRCVGGGVEAYQVCGDFDEDVCREWGVQVECDPGLVCNPTTGSCRNPYPAGPYGTHYGDTMENMCLEDGLCNSNGEMICMDEYVDRKATLIMVHSGWCPSCNQQMQGIEQFYQTYVDQGLGILQVLIEDDAYNGSRQALLDYACKEIKMYHLTFPVAIDPGGRVTNKFFDQGYIPLNMIVDQSMVIRYKVEGWDPAAIEAVVQQLLSR